MDNDDNGYEIVEVNFDIMSPKHIEKSLLVYLGTLNYLEYYKKDLYFEGDLYFDDYKGYLKDNLDTDISLPSGSDDDDEHFTLTEFYDDYYFDIKIIDPYKYPILSMWRRYDGESNNCSNMAATSLLLYYDKWYSNSYFEFRQYGSDFFPTQEKVNPFFYSTENSEIRYKDSSYFGYEIQDETTIMEYNHMFYEMMGTNGLIPNDGTNPELMYNAIHDYYDGIGIDTSIHPIFRSYSNLTGTDNARMDFNTYKTEIDSGHPVIMQLGLPQISEGFNADYTLIRNPETEIYDAGPQTRVYDYTIKYGAHTVIGYGYETHELINNGVSKDINFAIIANGWSNTSYINIALDSIDSAYSLRLNERTKPYMYNFSKSGNSVSFKVDFGDINNQFSNSESSIRILGLGIDRTINNINIQEHQLITINDINVENYEVITQFVFKNPSLEIERLDSNEMIQTMDTHIYFKSSKFVTGIILPPWQ